MKTAKTRFAGGLQLQGEQPALQASRAGPEHPFAAEAQGHEGREEQREANSVATREHVGQHAPGVGELLGQMGYRTGQGANTVSQIL